MFKDLCTSHRILKNNKKRVIAIGDDDDVYFNETTEGIAIKNRIAAVPSKWKG